MSVTAAEVYLFVGEHKQCLGLTDWKIAVEVDPYAPDDEWMCVAKEPAYHEATIFLRGYDFVDNDWKAHIIHELFHLHAAAYRDSLDAVLRSMTAIDAGAIDHITTQIEEALCEQAARAYMKGVKRALV